MVVRLRCNDDFEAIAARIREGSTVVYPTDTVYGLGSCPRSDIGVARCIELKGRETGKAMPVLCSSVSDAAELVHFSSEAKKLADVFWPGKLSMILPVRTKLPELLTGSNKDRSRSLAVRVPNHPCCVSLIRACGGTLIGTSANLSGKGPYTEYVNKELSDFAQRADYFVEGVCGSEARLPSTIIDLLDPKSLKMVREGEITYENIRRVLFSN